MVGLTSLTHSEESHELHGGYSCLMSSKLVRFTNKLFFLSFSERGHLNGHGVLHERGRRARPPDAVRLRQGRNSGDP